MKSLSVSSITLSSSLLYIYMRHLLGILLTQLDGIGMMELEELDHREIVERHYEDINRQIATDTGASAQVQRTLRKNII